MNQFLVWQCSVSQKKKNAVCDSIVSLEAVCRTRILTIQYENLYIGIQMPLI